MTESPLSFITQAGIYMRDRKSVDAKHPFKRMCIRLNRRLHTGCLEKSIQFSATCPSPALGSIGRWIMTSKVDCTLALR